MLNRHFLEFLGLLEKHHVEYVVVGGYAVGVHDFPRYTGDLNVFVATSRANAEAMVDVFAEFGFASLDLKPDDFLEPDTIVEIGREPVKIQILTGIDGVPFDRCREDRVSVEMAGLSIPFIGFDSLLANKAATPRAKDKIDLEELRRIRDEKNRKRDEDDRGPRHLASSRSAENTRIPLYRSDLFRR